MSPTAPPSPCPAPLCPALVKGGGRCPEHDLKRSHDRSRPTAAQRGYGSRWRRYAKGFLRRPENAVCAACGRAAATQVDHIEPATGPADARFWEPANHQGLCGPCHSRKTATEDGRWTGGATRGRGDQISEAGANETGGESARVRARVFPENVTPPGEVTG